MSDKLPTDVQAVLDEWSPDAGNDWQIAMWEAFDKVVRDQATSIERLTAEKDGAYAERNKLVAALSKLFPSHQVLDQADFNWRIIYILLPTGQVSWHIGRSEWPMFSHVRMNPPSMSAWDGHATEEKYARLAALAEGE